MNDVALKWLLQRKVAGFVDETLQIDKNKAFLKKKIPKQVHKPNL
jgi:hypothetical protein